ncbi:thiolase family protein [Armatimonas rosea]|uniref:acetyl-CoA C-acyltransferase n=1 Tax=Armatimonas rosea TaxID=685828 RepID=A0A7W9SV52_ARMRO|nr:thiolase family protein [Armatimonas rosea]MBB6053442.1 acetyl-CoA acyltransferase [Armatimonas rosea]
MNSVVIVAAGRSAIAKSPKGSFRDLRPDDLAAAVLRGVLERVPQFSLALIDDVILGCATPELEQGMDVARVAALRAGLPESVAGLTLNRFCASGLEAIATAAAKLATGQASFILAGGVESMTRAPFMSESLRPNESLPAETWLGMGEAVERVAVEEGITRAQCDSLALQSQQRAAAAQAAGKFDTEIIPITLPDGPLVNRDEGIRAETTLEGLAGLKTPFGGVITAGNASQRSDGAAAVLLTTEALAREHGLTPLARFVGYATAAVDPVHFGIAPAAAIPKLLERTGITLDQIDLIEFNEAFAAQALASQRHFPLDWNKVNVNGGAIALGHPLGATGARQTVTLLHEAPRRGARYGMVTMCAALGMGAAGLFEFL